MSDVPKLTRILQNPIGQVDIEPRGQILAPAFREPVPPMPFKFLANNGLWLNVRPETRGNGLYWSVNKQHDGRRHRLYIAPAGKLTRLLLENAAIHIAGVTVSAET